VTHDFTLTDSVAIGSKVSLLEGGYALAVGTHKSGYSSTGNTFDITVSQTLDLQLGDSLHGWSAWYNGDNAPQDTVWVKIFDSLGTEVANPWNRLSGPGSPDGVDYLAASPWTPWEWISPDAGAYTLVLGATTSGDNRFPTIGLHDGISLTAVPEPATYAAILGGLALLVVVIRRVRGRSRA